MSLKCVPQVTQIPGLFQGNSWKQVWKPHYPIVKARVREISCSWVRNYSMNWRIQRNILVIRRYRCGWEKEMLVLQKVSEAMVVSGQSQVLRDLEEQVKLSMVSWWNRMYILEVNLLRRQASILNAPVRSAGRERNRRIVMGREGLERVLVWDMRWERMSMYGTDLLEWIYVLWDKFRKAGAQISKDNVIRSRKYQIFWTYVSQIQ